MCSISECKKKKNMGKSQTGKTEFHMKLSVATLFVCYISFYFIIPNELRVHMDLFWVIL